MSTTKRITTMRCLTRQQEIERILNAYGNDFADIMVMLERQFTVLHNRAQVLLALCGIVISTTGFSGRIIAGTNDWAQLFIIIGVSLIVLSAAVVSWGVLHLRWLTLQKGDTIADWLDESIRYRNTKTAIYRVGLLVMLVGLICYVVSIAIMLENPNTNGLPAR